MKDDLANVQRFVRGNLAGGVDHIVVFLDGPQPAVTEWLAVQDHVTTVAADGAWWGEERPDRLNKRQIISANLVRSVLAQTRWAEWIFHVDADEVVQIDRDVLAAVPAQRRAVRLEPLGVVSQLRPDGVPTWFKRLLADDELTLQHGGPPRGADDAVGGAADAEQGALPPARARADA